MVKLKIILFKNIALAKLVALFTFECGDRKGKVKSEKAVIKGQSSNLHMFLSTFVLLDGCWGDDGVRGKRKFLAQLARLLV